MTKPTELPKSADYCGIVQVDPADFELPISGEIEGLIAELQSPRRVRRERDDGYPYIETIAPTERELRAAAALSILQRVLKEARAAIGRQGLYENADLLAKIDALLNQKGK